MAPVQLLLLCYTSAAPHCSHHSVHSLPTLEVLTVHVLSCKLLPPAISDWSHSRVQCTMHCIHCLHGLQQLYTVPDNLVHQTHACLLNFITLLN